jgi:hypothetical protein
MMSSLALGGAGTLESHAMFMNILRPFGTCAWIGEVERVSSVPKCLLMYEPASRVVVLMQKPAVGRRVGLEDM